MYSSSSNSYDSIIHVESSVTRSVSNGEKEGMIRVSLRTVQAMIGSIRLS